MSLISASKYKPSRSGNVIPRERLFSALDAARSHRLIWLAAAPGSGKTLFLSSYVEQHVVPCLWHQLEPADHDPAVFFQMLAEAAESLAPSREPLPLFGPEHFHALPVFARRFFEDLDRRFSGTGILVFDDYHELPEPSPLHSVFRHGLEALPAHLNAVILSRRTPPASLTRLFTNGSATLFPGDSLRLTLEESLQLAAGQSSDPDPERIRVLHARTEGWAAGFVLTLAHQGTVAANLSRETLFDYFAGEVLDGLDPSIERFLKKVSLFPEFTAKMAERLTGMRDCEHLLTGMVRKNQFTTCRDEGGQAVYRFHDLFRQCLAARAERTFREGELDVLRRAAVAILLESDLIHDAFSLLVEAGLWDEAAGLIRSYAGRLAAQGQFSTLANWAARIPAHRLRRDPWLLFWHGTAIQSLGGPQAARNLFEQAFDGFQGQKDAAGLYLAWSSIVEGYLFEWNDLRPIDRWFSIFAGLQKNHPECPDPEIEARVVNAMFSALCFRRPWDPEVEVWCGRAETMFRKSMNPLVRFHFARQFIIWYVWKGDLKKVEALRGDFDTIAPGQWGAGLEKIHLQVGRVCCYWWTGRLAQAEPILEEALADAERSGAPAMFHMLLSLGAFIQLAQGKPDLALKYIHPMGNLPFADCKLEQGNFHYLKALEMVHREHYPAALQHVERSLRCAFVAGAPNQVVMSLLSTGQVLAALGQYKRASRHLRRARQVARRIGSALFLYRYELASAEIAFSRGDGERGLDHLRRGLGLARANRIAQTEWWRPAVMAELCARALEAGIEVEFVREIIEIHNFSPPESFADLENWPRPVRIYTLGRFAVIKDGTPLRSERKAQKKPIELLQVLIAMGGRGVRQTEIEDALWPSASGDAARRSFNMALHRLRKLVGAESLRLEEGKLTLNPRFCWVDIWAFERRLREIEAMLQQVNNPPVEFSQVVANTMDLLQGTFLGREAEHPWMLPLREKLRHRVRRLFNGLGLYFCGHQSCEKAIAVYRKALEIDPLAEEFYRNLMVCYTALDRHPEALAAYQSCRKTLSARLNVHPSLSTETLLRAILQQEPKAVAANCTLPYR